MSWDAFAFLKDYHIPYATEGANCQKGWVNICCPFCHDSSFHGGFNPVKEYYNCWKCGYKDLKKVVREVLHVSFKEADSIYFEYTGRNSLLRTLNQKDKKKKVVSMTLPGSPMKSPHKRYLKRRKFDPDFLAEKYGLQGTGPNERWNKKDYQLMIIIPIIDTEGRLLTFQGRDITGKSKTRYKAAPLEFSVVDIKETLYNMNHCYSSRIILVEGVTDVWRLGDNTAATFGTSMTDGQIKLLSRFREIFWLFDPEPAAQERANKGATKLASLGKSVELIKLKDVTRDPAEFTEKEVEHLRKELGL